MEAVGTNSGPFFVIEMDAGYALLLVPSVTSVMLKAGECFCMGERLEVNKNKYIRPFSTTIFFTIDRPCTLSFRVPFSYHSKPYNIRPLFDAFSRISGTTTCPVTLVCGGSANENAIVVRILIQMMKAKKIFPLCMDLDVKSPCLCLPGTVSCARLAQKEETEFLGLDYKIPAHKNETISFLYGNTQVTDKKFYNQLVENLTVRVVGAVKKNSKLSEYGIIVNGPSSKDELRDVINIVRPSSVILIGEGFDRISEIGPFDVYRLESIDINASPACHKKSGLLSYFDSSSSFVVKNVDLRSITVVSEDGEVVKPEALRSEMVLGVVYNMESDPFLLKHFVCVVSVNGSKADLLFPSKRAAEMKPKIFIATKVLVKDF